jgi:uncharacterized protein DUF4406
LGRIVFVSSPYRGEVERNIDYARRALRSCLLRGEVPFAPHLLYTQPGVLSDDDELEREAGIRAGTDILRLCDAMIVFRDYGISTGMQFEIDLAKDWGIPIEYRWLP